jgi:osmoprotectant transport system ATP-binding protein
MIALDGLSKSYDDNATLAVHDVSMRIEQGELLVLLGTSGCGKTTTLKMINRLIEPTRGTIHLDGEDVGALDPVRLRRRIGYVFQGIGLFPHFTVGANVAAVPSLLGWSRAETRARADELLELMDLPPRDYRDRMPAHLSGGQKQRVGVARALAARPKVMLMDEPFGALDPITRDTLQTEYRKLHDDLGLTTVMVTHDMTEALLLADRIAVMDEGRIIQIGTPHELLSNPKHEYVEQLMQTPKRQADQLEALAANDGEAGDAG